MYQKGQIKICTHIIPLIGLSQQTKDVFTPNAMNSKHVYYEFNLMYTGITLKLFTSKHLVQLPSVYTWFVHTCKPYFI